MTDHYEIMIVIGVNFIMSYNRLPSIRHYWSNNISLGNAAIKNAIARNRFTLLSSKMYFNDPTKPINANKIYPIEEVLSCLKSTFQSSRSDSPFQSIDESMAKFKGRSSLKQYMPSKPIKRGIKLWQRCDSETGYVYDMNIYAGKDDQSTSGTTLGARVVQQLCSTIKDSDVAICFDRFFTSVDLVNTLPYACVGTCSQTRKNVPKMDQKLNRGEFVCLKNQFGVIAFKWKDSKEIYVLSNCHNNDGTEVTRKGRDGIKKKFPCPEAIAFYNRHMHGVDLCDQLVSCYDYNRRSNKWWKKVFDELLMTSAVNSWIIYKQILQTKTPFLNFLIVLAECLISLGKEKANVVRKFSSGRPPKKPKLSSSVGNHFPSQGTTRRRCIQCAQNNKEKRTKIVCVQCNIPLCNNCFALFHTSKM